MDLVLRKLGQEIKPTLEEKDTCGVGWEKKWILPGGVHRVHGRKEKSREAPRRKAA